VDASDISQAQIANAKKKENIEYYICPAEHTPFADTSFDLITVAQAYHWINWKRFHNEATRIGKPGSVVAIWMYNMPYSQDEKVTGIIRHFYRDITGPYWDKERKYIDDNYQTIPFPFDEIASPPFENTLAWTFEHLIGYIGTWSAVKHYKKARDKDPVDLVYDELKKAWGDREICTGRLPILLRVARIGKESLSR